jgi:hypothetical protein
MEEETMENPTSSNSSLYYILGAIVLVAVIGAGYLLRPKTASPGGQAQVGATPTITPTPGPITRLACESQYYNPVLGFPKYYFSVEGADLTGPSSVDCTMTISQENRIVSTEKSTVSLAAKPDRGGNVFKCTTAGLEVKPTIPTKVEVSLRDDQGAKATCSAVFALPKQ